MSTTLTSKGQVTIPKAIRDLLGLKAGCAVDFVVAEDGRVVLSPARQERTSGARRDSRFARLRGTATVGMSTDEIMALTRGDD